MPVSPSALRRRAPGERRAPAIRSASSMCMHGCRSSCGRMPDDGARAARRGDGGGDPRRGRGPSRLFAGDARCRQAAMREAAPLPRLVAGRAAAGLGRLDRDAQGDGAGGRRGRRRAVRARALGDTGGSPPARLRPRHHRADRRRRRRRPAAADGMRTDRRPRRRGRRDRGAAGRDGAAYAAALAPSWPTSRAATSTSPACPFADTALMLERLAAPRGLAAAPESRRCCPSCRAFADRLGDLRLRVEGRLERAVRRRAVGRQQPELAADLHLVEDDEVRRPPPVTERDLVEPVERDGLACRRRSR